LRLSTPLVVDAYEANRATGAFILVDEATNETVGAGMLTSTTACPSRLDRGERVFYHLRMRVEYREEPCRNALNRVKGMPFKWSLNPYTGCAHRCTFCYVRAFEARAERPADERYGRSIRVKTNIAEVLRNELGRAAC